MREWCLWVGLGFLLSNCERTRDQETRLRFFAAGGNRTVAVGERLAITLERVGSGEAANRYCISFSITGTGRLEFAPATDASAGYPGFVGEVNPSGGLFRMNGPGRHYWVLAATETGRVFLRASLLDSNAPCDGTATDAGVAGIASATPLVITVTDRAVTGTSEADASSVDAPDDVAADDVAEKDVGDDIATDGGLDGAANEGVDVIAAPDASGDDPDAAADDVAEGEG